MLRVLYKNIQVLRNFIILIKSTCFIDRMIVVLWESLGVEYMERPETWLRYKQTFTLDVLNFDFFIVMHLVLMNKNKFVVCCSDWILC
jgi:hypothetical protein